MSTVAGQEFRDPIRLGIVGLGSNWEWQSKALSFMPQFRIAAAADTDKTREVLIPYSVPFCLDYREMLCREDVDAVVISTPLPARFEIASDALVKGFPVLLEKPAANSTHDLRELYAIASESGALLVVAYQASFAMDVRWTARYLKYGEGACFGPLTGFWAGFYDPYASEDKAGRMYASLGGSWMGSGASALSVLAAFTNLSNLEVTSSTTTELPPSQSDARTVVGLGAPASEGAATLQGSIETNWLLGASQRSTVLSFRTMGTYIHVDHTNETVRVFQGDRCRRHEDCGIGRNLQLNHYGGVFDDFASRLRTWRDNRALSLEIHRLLFNARDFVS